VPIIFEKGLIMSEEDGSVCCGLELRSGFKFTGVEDELKVRKFGW